MDYKTFMEGRKDRSFLSLKLTFYTSRLYNMSYDQGDMMLLTRYCDLTTEEAGKLLGLSPKMAELRLAQAQKKLDKVGY